MKMTRSKAPIIRAVFERNSARSLSGESSSNHSFMFLFATGLFAERRMQVYTHPIRKFPGHVDKKQASTKLRNVIMARIHCLNAHTTNNCIKTSNYILCKELKRPLDRALMAAA